MKVETNLAPGNHAFIMHQRFDLLFRAVVVETRVMWMCANRGVNVLVCSAKLDRTLQRATVRVAGADIENGQNTRCVCSFEHRIPIRIKLRSVKVRVRIYKHLCLLFTFWWLISNAR